MRAARSRRPFVAIAAVLLAAAMPATSRAAVQIEASVQVVPVARAPRLDIDVWTNKDEGGVYRQGEAMRVFFRPSDDAYVLIYNIDTEGYIHLVYPYDPGDPDRVEGGRTYQVPARNDPYDLVADGPAGIEYVVAIASPFPFRNLPWYLNGENAGRAPGDYGDEGDDDDYGESGQIVGDPYVGMDRVVRQIVPRGRENDVATADTYFYIERRVEYPRYVCADCHSYGWYDPYGDVCSVFDIRIDATWAHYRPLRSSILRPRYYYMVRSTAPTRYRQWKDRWSSMDGRATLRERFRVDSGDKFQSRRQMIQRRTPPEFQNFRTRPRPDGRIFRPNEVLRRDPTRDRTVRGGDGGNARDRGDVRDSQDARRRAWEQGRDQRENDRRQMQEQRREEQRQMQEQRRDDQRPAERDRGRVQERDNARRDNSGDRGQVRERRDSGGDRGGDRGYRGNDRGDRGGDRGGNGGGGDRGDRGGGGGRSRGNDRGR